MNEDLRPGDRVVAVQILDKNSPWIIEIGEIYEIQDIRLAPRGQRIIFLKNHPGRYHGIEFKKATTIDFLKRRISQLA